MADHGSARGWGGAPVSEAPDEEPRGERHAALLGSTAAGPTLKVLLERYERQLVEKALEAAGGNQRRAAARLGLLPTTLHEKLKRLGLLPRRGDRALSGEFDPRLR